MYPIEDWLALSAQEKRRLNHQFNLLPGGVVVQVGGYRGEWTAAAWCRYLPRELHVFEPVGEFFEELCLNTRACQGVVAHPFGLSNENAIYSFTLSEDGSSGFMALEEGGQQLLLPVYDVRETFERLGLNQIDLLYLNAEGAEYKILPRLMECDLIRNVRHILVQFHRTYQDAEIHRTNVRCALEITHQCEWAYDWIWESWRRKGTTMAHHRYNTQPFVPAYTPPPPPEEPDAASPDDVA